MIANNLVKMIENNIVKLKEQLKRQNTKKLKFSCSFLDKILGRKEILRD